MFERLKGIFTSVPADAADEQYSLPLAAAMLLLEVAWADHDIEESELEQIRTALGSMYEIDAAQIEELVRKAREEHDTSTGVYPFTRLLNDRLTREERRVLLGHLWRLASFEGDQYHYEEHVIRKITDLLYLNHSDFIHAKLEVKAER